MSILRLLIVDDSDDNRLILRTICKKLEGFEIKEAVDGVEAVKMAKEWSPHIILMDIMMPNMDGFEASKIIKKTYPEIIIIAVTAVSDSRMQENMNKIGVDIYIQKPIDRELIRYKLESISSFIRSVDGKMKSTAKKNVLNPFNSDIRSFKTFFEIIDEEASMDFGMWLFEQFNGRAIPTSNKFDSVINIFYKLMRQGHKDFQAMNIIVEESYEEFYITMKFETPLAIEANTLDMLNSLGTQHIAKENIVCIRLEKAGEIINKKAPQKEITQEEIIQEDIEKEEKQKKIEEIKEKSNKEKRVIDSSERELLHQSFVDKTSAADYVAEIGGDVLDEILDLSSIDEEWMMTLSIIEENPNEESLIKFADSVLSTYVKAINNLFEFTALAYALSSLSVFIKNSANTISQDKENVKKLTMLLEHLGSDLSSWREHIFILQDTADIHYLDSSFFSSCMQIEGIISDKDLGDDDDNDMEFF